MIESAVYALLTADSACKALIDTRVYPLNLPTQPTLPAITYRLVSTTEEYTLSGSTGCITARFQLDCWGKTYPECRSVAKAVRNALNDYTGSPVDGCHITDISRDGEQTGYDEYALSYYTQQDWLVVYSD